jgi:prolyl-tRNA synthetase
MDDGARERMFSRIQTIDSIETLPSKVVRFGWCGEAECGHQFEQRTELKLLGSPYTKEDFQGKCIVCGKETDRSAYAARAM